MLLLKNFKKLLACVLPLLLCSCVVGPNYHGQSVVMPNEYKEICHTGWKVAQPNDHVDRGEWWKIFNDPQLNALEAKLNCCNQNIMVAITQYGQARSLVDAARASYFPTIVASATITRQKQVSTNGVTTLGSAGTVSTSGTNEPFTTHSLMLNATWEPDFWGGVRRSVEANVAGTEAAFANIAVVRLSEQALLAQTYFQLRALDTDQKVLDTAVMYYKSALKLTQNRYNAGVAGLSDIVQARSQLESAQAQAVNNGIARAQSEHAIAVLLGLPPELFCLPPQPLTATPPAIPIEFPCALLERRPDIAEAERQMAQANAQVGVTIAAYYPNFPLTATGTDQGPNLSHWLSLPDISWELGSSVVETLFDGGLRKANTNAAWSNYSETIATYRQTVLGAFQSVEDSLAELGILNCEIVYQEQAASSARLAAKLLMNQYKAGTVAYTDVIVAQNAALIATKNAADVNGLRMVAAVALIKSLGGGWDACDLSRAVDYARRRPDQSTPNPITSCSPLLPGRGL